jgi:hypothetical protein
VVKSEAKRERGFDSFIAGDGDGDVEILGERPIKRIKEAETIDLT